MNDDNLKQKISKLMRLVDNMQDVFFDIEFKRSDSEQIGLDAIHSKIKGVYNDLFDVKQKI